MGAKSIRYIFLLLFFIYASDDIWAIGWLMVGISGRSFVRELTTKAMYLVERDYSLVISDPVAVRKPA